MTIYKKKTSIGQWYKKENLKDGDFVEIANEGKEVEGDFGWRTAFLIKDTAGEEGNVSFNQTSKNGMIDAYGANAVSWVGKKVRVWKIKQNVAGKFIDVFYFSHPNAELTEDGFIMPNGKVNASDDIPVIDPTNDEIDEINTQING